MKKNTLIVFIVILTPIIIMGSLAVMGASNLPTEHEGTEGENEQVEGDGSVPATVTHAVLPLSYQYSASTLVSAV